MRDGEEKRRVAGQKLIDRDVSRQDVAACELLRSMNEMYRERNALS